MRAVSAGIMTVAVTASTPTASAAEAVAAATPTASAAESTPQSPSHDAASPGVPTTKLMAIGTRTAKGTPDAVKQLLPSEIRQTVQLYLAGKLDQWCVKQDQTGVIFILNVTDPDQARPTTAMDDSLQQQQA